jgi:hypothetical protein
MSAIINTGVPPKQHILLRAGAHVGQRIDCVCNSAGLRKQRFARSERFASSIARLRCALIRMMAWPRVSRRSNKQRQSGDHSNNDFHWRASCEDQHDQEANKFVRILASFLAAAAAVPLYQKVSFGG